MEAFYSIREENELLGIDLVSDFAVKHLWRLLCGLRGKDLKTAKDGKPPQRIARADCSSTKLRSS
jgi:hypothetical protein